MYLHQQNRSMSMLLLFSVAVVVDMGTAWTTIHRLYMTIIWDESSNCNY